MTFSSKPKQKAKRPDEIQSRYMTIGRWSASMYFSVDKPRGLPPERRTLQCIEFFGTLDEPIKGLTQVHGSLFPAEKVAIGRDVDPSVGSIQSLQERVEIAAHLTNQEYSWLLILAAGKALEGAHMAFHKPSYGHALIVSLSFYSQLPPAEER